MKQIRKDILIRAKSPQSKKGKSNLPIALVPIANRSKSTASFSKVKEQLCAYQDRVLQNKGIQRAKSAFKLQHKMTNSNVLIKSSIFSKANKGKLHLGKLNKPDIILTNQMRHNPWGEPTPIHEQVISRKGLLNVINMGIVPNTADITELLNTKFEIDKTNNSLENNTFQIFATNPIINNDLEQSLNNMKEVQQVNNIEAVPEQSPTKKRKKKRVKKVSVSKEKQDMVLDFRNPNVILKMSNKQIVKDEEYKIQLQKSKLEGYEIQFKQYISKFQQFAQKYHARKFQFYLKINATKKLSDFCIINHILNSKVLGIQFALSGGKLKKNKEVMRMLLYRWRYKKAKRNLEKLDHIKKYYRVKKYYEQMMAKRVNLLQFKYGSFIQNQRRYFDQIEQGNLKHSLKYRIQFHIPNLYIGDLQKKSSFYKLKERNNIQLTCLFNNSPEHLIVLMNQSSRQQLDISPWSKIIDSFNSYHSIVTVINCGIGRQFEDKVNEYDAIYYGLNNREIVKIRKILSFKSKKKVEYGDFGLIPSGFPNSVVKITEMFDLALCGGSFLPQNISYIKQEQEQIPNESSDPEITIVQKLKIKMKSMNSFELINNLFNNKFHNKKTIANFGCKTPFYLFFEPSKSNQKDNLKKFLGEFSQKIISRKNTYRWIIKLNTEQRFSRGLGFLETDTLKIVKEKKKKPITIETDIEELANSLKMIMQDKLIIAQNSLQDRIEFIQRFFKEGGYLEEYIEDAHTCCLFGNLHPNGQYEHLGTYDKIYTDQIVNCAAFYPSTVITQLQLRVVEDLAKKLFTNYRLYGKITFQFLFDSANNQFYLIDIIPSIEQYSSFFYLYYKYFATQKADEMKMSIVKSYKKQSKEFEKQNDNNSLKFINKLLPLKKKILYCPFIDNNGNIFNSFQEFEEIKQKYKLKIDYKILEGLQFLYLNLQEKLPDALSMFSMADTPKKAFKLCLDGLNFLIETGEKPNKFDKKVERRKYDCVFINDIIWKLREINKNLDNQEIKKNKDMQLKDKY